MRPLSLGGTGVSIYMTCMMPSVSSLFLCLSTTTTFPLQFTPNPRASTDHHPILAPPLHRGMWVDGHPWLCPSTIGNVGWSSQQPIDSHECLPPGGMCTYLYGSKDLGSARSHQRENPQWTASPAERGRKSTRAGKVEYDASDNTQDNNNNTRCEHG